MKECSGTWSEVEKKSLDLLRKYPLCDSCLGRCFARLSYGLSNKERGKSIKISLMLSLDRAVKEHEIEELSDLKELIFNMGKVAEPWFKLYFPKEEFQSRACFICNDEIESLKDDFERKSYEILQEDGIKSYVLGVKLSDSVKSIEDELVINESLKYYESIKHEIKREVGKRLAEKGFPPDMDNSQWEVVYDLGTRSVFKLRNIKKQLNFFNRLSRGVPISNWNSSYPDSLSIEMERKGRKIYYAVSERPDIRILTDYPLVTDEGPDVNVEGYYVKSSSKITRRDLSLIVSMKPKRRYRVMVYSNNPKEGWVKVYDKLYDVFVDANSPEEVREALEDEQILFIDLVSYKGRLSKVADLYMRKENM
ncbi:hypothetical protein [Sulfuracidifex tepidarius]|uniref:tRNA pseudouridine synthase Pus10 n=1 Tax=Sulfuracidifex tepidarius TaxID=1294262 RepID=A0A510DUN6_9CREN|nr:hypothetical protein [Sulfuracidifex tepidarius]BBG23889.1 tRNA pseudouridine synthase Pus10 [Sulfuracidifex tepidarius]BBG26644.1 tRNA pseudouridine synthase Pus10 [Sulfuracidifex tepidarius]